jgi:hypothetical protein
MIIFVAAKFICDLRIAAGKVDLQAFKLVSASHSSLQIAQSPCALRKLSLAARSVAKKESRPRQFGRVQRAFPELPCLFTLKICRMYMAPVA